MEDVKIIEVPLSKMDSSSALCYKLRGEKYFIAPENQPEKRVSILFEDLSWIRKHFGDKNIEHSPITKDSLNVGRRNHISNLELCIELGVPMWELNNYDKDNKVWYDSEDNEPYLPTKLSDSGINLFKKEIEKGLYLLYMIVD